MSRSRSTRRSDVTEGPWAGWIKIEPGKDGRFFSIFAPVYAQVRSETSVVLALETRELHSNTANVLHGGFVAAVADQAGYLCLVVLGHNERFMVTTIETKLQLMSGAKVGVPLHVEVELLKETGRFYFERLTFRQEGEIVAAATGTLRKTARRE